MSVHDKDKYVEIKEALGIPEDEPIFIIRGKDSLAPTMLDLYDLLYMSTAREQGVSSQAKAFDFSNDIRLVYDEVIAYQKDNPDLVRVPD